MSSSLSRAAMFFRGAYDHGNISASMVVNHRLAFVQFFNPQTTGIGLTAPLEAGLKPGFPYMILVNLSGTNSMTIVPTGDSLPINSAGFLSRGANGWLFHSLSMVNVALSAVGFFSFLFGGSGGLNFTQRFNSAATVWTQQADSGSHLLSGSDCTEHGSLSYLFGSVVVGSSQTATSIFNHTLNVFSAGTNTPISMGFASGAADIVGVDEVYLFGSGNLNQKTRQYTPSTDSWATLAQEIRDRIWAPAESIGTDVFLMSGNDIFNGSQRLFDKYDSTVDTWANVADMSLPFRSFCSAAKSGGLIYAGMGEENQPGVPSVPSGVWEEYTPGTNTWAAKTTNATPRSRSAAFGLDSKIYLAGGSLTGFLLSAGFLSTVESYSPATDTWSTEPSLLGARSNCTNHGTTIGNT